MDNSETKFNQTFKKNEKRKKERRGQLFSWTNIRYNVKNRNISNKWTAVRWGWGCADCCLALYCPEEEYNLKWTVTKHSPASSRHNLDGLFKCHSLDFTCKRTFSSAAKPERGWKVRSKNGVAVTEFAVGIHSFAKWQLTVFMRKYYAPFAYGKCVFWLVVSLYTGCGRVWESRGGDVLTLVFGGWGRDGTGREGGRQGVLSHPHNKTRWQWKQVRAWWDQTQPSLSRVTSPAHMQIHTRTFQHTDDMRYENRIRSGDPKAHTGYSVHSDMLIHTRTQQQDG